MKKNSQMYRTRLKVVVVVVPAAGGMGGAGGTQESQGPGLNHQFYKFGCPGVPAMT